MCVSRIESDHDEFSDDDELLTAFNLPKYNQKKSRRYSVSASSDIKLDETKPFPTHGKSSGETKSIKQILKRYHTLFGGLDKNSSAIIIDAMEKQTHKAGKILIQEGDLKADFCYFVDKGELSVTKKSVDGRTDEEVYVTCMYYFCLV